ncbi:hypothetical protein RRG08_008818 [Elysia crispata]|uniref:Ig-like domain-containing protein n=1 Tax=Elysia crispata TaxID=231223 RepID=A0AAE0ZXR0_9GAST|nr:hypothetical protein RRG08_008818 [Elysia crispata]
MASETARTAGIHLFHCAVLGDPPPTIRWVKDGQAIEGDPRFLFHYSEDGLVSMVIRDVTPADSGHYQCIAENSEGIATSSSHLIVKGVHDKAQTSPHVSAQIMAIDDSDGFHEIIWRSPDTATTETRLQTQPATDEVSFAGGLEASGTERDRTYSPPPLKSSTSHTLHIYDDEQCENLPSDNTTPHQASVSPPSSPQTTLLEELTSHLQDDSGFFDTSLSLNDSHINTPSSQSQGRTLHSTRRAFHQANSCDLSQRLEETVTSSVREVSLAGSSSSGTHQHSREERSLLFTPLAHTNSSCVDNASDIVVSTQQTEKHAIPRNVTFQSTPNEKSLSNSTRGCSRSAYQDSRREDKSSKSCSEDLSTASEQSNKEVYNGAECSTTWVDYLESHSETSPDPGHDLQVEGPAVRDNEVSDRHSSEDDTQDMGDTYHRASQRASTVPAELLRPITLEQTENSRRSEIVSQEAVEGLSSEMPTSILAAAISDQLNLLPLSTVEVVESSEGDEAETNRYRMCGRELARQAVRDGVFDMSNVVRTMLEDGAVQLRATMQMPQFVECPSDVTVPTFGTIILTCVVRGNPEPKVTWATGKKRSELKAGERVFETRQGDVHRLEIRSASPSDTGTYICTASNSEGHVVATVTVTVEGKI